MGDTSTRRRLAVATALACGALDLALKATVHADLRHERSASMLLLIGLVAMMLVAFVPLLPSRSAAFAAGIGVGGAGGNAISAIAWSGGVPDPLVVSWGGAGVAFNLADVFALSGAALLVVSAGLCAMRHPAALRRPVRSHGISPTS